MQSYDFTLSQSRKASTHLIQLDLVPQGSSVLDIGCHTGVLGEALGREKGCSVIGVDFNSEALVEARPRLKEVIQLDIEQPGWSNAPQLQGRQFDVVLFGDVLEHTREPLAILRESKSLLKRGGQLIVSIPNVANLRVRLGLLAGRFDYSDAGILDKGHLRFFTEKSARQLVEQAGFTILSQNVSGYTLPPGLIRMFPRLLAVNFIFTARP